MVASAQVVNELSSALERLTKPLSDVVAQVEAFTATLQKASDRLGAFEKLPAEITKAQTHLENLGKTLRGENTGEINTGSRIFDALLSPLQAFARREEMFRPLREAIGKAGGNPEKDTPAVSQLAENLGESLPGTTADYVGMLTNLVTQGASVADILGGLGKASAYLAVQLKIPATQAGELTRQLQTSTHTSSQDMLPLLDKVQRIAGISGLSGDNAFKALSSLFAGVQDSAKVSRAALMAGVPLNFNNAAGQFGGVDQMLAELARLGAVDAGLRASVLQTLAGNDPATLKLLAQLTDNGETGFAARQKQLAALPAMTTSVDRQSFSGKELSSDSKDWIDRQVARLGGWLLPVTRWLANTGRSTADTLADWSAEHPGIHTAATGVVGFAGALQDLIGSILGELKGIVLPSQNPASAAQKSNGISTVLGSGVALLAGLASVAHLLWQAASRFVQPLVDRVSPLLGQAPNGAQAASGADGTDGSGAALAGPAQNAANRQQPLLTAPGTAGNSGSFVFNIYPAAGMSETTLAEMIAQQVAATSRPLLSRPGLRLGDED